MQCTSSVSFVSQIRNEPALLQKTKEGTPRSVKSKEVTPRSNQPKNATPQRSNPTPRKPVAYGPSKISNPIDRKRTGPLKPKPEIVARIEVEPNETQICPVSKVQCAVKEKTDASVGDDKVIGKEKVSVKGKVIGKDKVSAKGKVVGNEKLCDDKCVVGDGKDSVSEEILDGSISAAALSTELKSLPMHQPLAPDFFPVEKDKSKVS